MRSQTSAGAGIRLSSHESHLKCSYTKGASKFRKEGSQMDRSWARLFQGMRDTRSVMGSSLSSAARMFEENYEDASAYDIALLTWHVPRQKTVPHAEHRTVTHYTTKNGAFLCNLWICLRPSLPSRTIHLNTGVQVQLALSPVNGAGHVKFLPSTSNAQTVQHLQLPTLKTDRSI